MNIHKPTLEEKEALSIARIQILNKQGNTFFATLVMNSQSFWTKDIETAGTNGIDLIINPDYFMNLTSQERVFLLVHECLHKIYEHVPRWGNRDGELWNAACDFVVNNTLKDHNYAIPEGSLIDQRFKEMSAEEVYEHLRKQSKPPKSNMPDLLPDANPRGNEGDGDQDNSQGNQPAYSQQEIEKHVKELTLQAVQTAQLAKDAGSIPGHVERELDALLNPKLPWDAILRRFLNSFQKNDITWTKPNRRFLHRGIILPTAHSESIGQIDFAIDTSGSVSQSDFNRFISEIAYVFKRFKPDGVGVYQFDHILQTTDKVANLREFQKLKFTGGGGTNIEPVLNYFRDESQGKALIILTDGYFHHTPQMNPNKPVVWLIYDNPKWKPPFGTAIYFDN